MQRHVRKRILSIMAGSPRRSATIVVLVLVLVVLIIASVRFIIAWANRPAVPTVYAMKQIRLNSGQTVYLKRQASSMNHDHLSLSLNGDRCRDEDWNIDFRFRSLDAPDEPVYYVAGDNTLTIFDTLDEPTQLKWPFKVRQETLPLKIEQHSHDSTVSVVEIRASDLTSCP